MSWLPGMEMKVTGEKLQIGYGLTVTGFILAGNKVSSGTRGVDAELASIDFDYDNLCSLMTLAVSTVRREGSMPKDVDKTSRQRL